MTSVEVFKPKSNYAFAAAALILDGLFVVQSLLYPDGSGLVATLAIALAIAAATALLWIRPKLVLGESELRVVNPLRSHTIAYRDIDQLETKWSLLIRHNGVSTRVWVAPASGRIRWGSSMVTNWKSPVSSTTLSNQIAIGHVPVSESVHSESGLAALLIQRRIDELGRH
ncbi:MAG: hypothetical protein ACKOWJ_02195 [Micrococcales bacterium]